MPRTRAAGRSQGWPRLARILGIAASLCMGAACGGRNRYAPPPPPEVTVARPVEREVTNTLDFTGHTVAVESVEIRARVKGELRSVDFVPGSEVRRGDLLFVIEPELYQARVDQAQADLEGKEAQHRAAEAQLEITEAIFRKSAGSRTDVVQKTQARDLAKAQVAMARATLEAAKLDLSYTHIYAPISGRIDRNYVDVGNLVGSGDPPTLLTTIVRDDPIYVYFTASERDLLEYREFQHQNYVAYLGLATESGYPHRGSVNYAANRVDPTTGTIEVRAVFPNPDRRLVPGLFARVRLPLTREQALLVPAAAVSFDQGGAYVLSVDAKDTVQYRRVELGIAVGSELQVVRSGVSRNDWVIVAGLQSARPGGVVKPQRSEIQAPVPTPEPSPSVSAAADFAATRRAPPTPAPSPPNGAE